MKKIRKLFLPVFLAAAMTFSACSLPNSSNSTSVQVDEEGAVTETIIEEKDGDYTEEELTDYIRQSVGTMRVMNRRCHWIRARSAETA